MAMTTKDPILLNQLLRLDRETGRLYWRQRGLEWFQGAKRPAQACAAWNSRFAGKEALIANKGEGYRRGRILDMDHLAHRVVFAIANGRWPDADVDHRDGDPGNNRPGNLREATKPENMRNRLGNKRGATSSSYCGVCWSKSAEKWMAYCSDREGKRRHIGVFSEEVDAAHAYDAAAREWHGEFARTNFPVTP